MSGGGRRCVAGAATALAIAAGVLDATGAGAVGAPDCSANQDPAPPPSPDPASKGRVVVVGDSMMLGARTDLEAAFSTAGYDVVVDAAESRSTLAGADVLAGHLDLGADAVVVMLGANDAANTDSYRTRVRAVLDQAALVPHVYWLTTPEVRSYYPAANQVLREELATRPGAEVLEWHAVSGGLTAGDGLHLTGPGAEAMAWFVAVNAIADLEAPPDPTVSPAPGDDSPDTQEPAEPAPVAEDPRTSRPDPGGGASSQDDTASRADGTNPGEDSDPDQGRRFERAAEVAAESSVWRLATPALLALAVVLGLLGLAGVTLAGWALWRSR